MKRMVVVTLLLLAVVSLLVSGCGTSKLNDESDTDELVVSSTSPKDGAEVSSDVIVYVTFNNRLDTDTISARTFFVRNRNDDVVPGVRSFSSDHRRMAFTSQDFYTAGETYTVYITTGIQDVDGNSMDEPYTFSFTIEDNN